MHKPLHDLEGGWLRCGRVALYLPHCDPGRNGGEASVSEGDIDASPTNPWYHTDPLLGHNARYRGGIAAASVRTWASVITGRSGVASAPAPQIRHGLRAIVLPKVRPRLAGRAGETPSTSTDALRSASARRSMYSSARFPRV